MTYVPALVQLDREEAAQRLADAVAAMMQTLDPKQTGYTATSRALNDYREAMR